MLEYDLTDSDEDRGSPVKMRDSEGSPKMLGSSMKKLKGGRLNTRMSASSSKGAHRMTEAFAAPILLRKPIEMIEEDDISF
jgi:hypothetical protein